MSWARDVMDALRHLILVEAGIASLTDRVDRLSHITENLSQRLARLEGKMEFLESLGQRRRLPPRS